MAPFIGMPGSEKETISAKNDGVIIMCRFYQDPYGHHRQRISSAVFNNMSYPAFYRQVELSPGMYIRC